MILVQCERPVRLACSLACVPYALVLLWPLGVHAINLRISPTAPSTQWHLQEDSVKTAKGMQMAGLYFLPFETMSVGPRPSPLEVAEDPEAVLFRRLEGLRERDTASLTPGRLLIAVYGDNWSVLPAGKLSFAEHVCQTTSQQQIVCSVQQQVHMRAECVRQC